MYAFVWLGGMEGRGEGDVEDGDEGEDEDKQDSN